MAFQTSHTLKNASYVWEHKIGYKNWVFYINGNLL